ncbi:hypothetical protein MVLG_06012 [Microbotryum lychnidis-dioicae p1A1 Lamole]|uniref:Uncharacterized protein n=1 Tax=Microbotryum lychnidis-dioicae (strain p1A1 Lamole / MvSl-1064) TaxID=683840 RepID=U5HFZ0_USTV1|nr:hypothetical protein MVLG_06012 [Microbotryum lychnidis-dioicae p1A1 Lamole]|eukprot:KDE03499.1 hypothetical protein MVLG_06012 [Microbotryum lychnidis-dioicae p1A1 Lamole]
MDSSSLVAARGGAPAQLAVSKVRQAAQANKDRADEPSWAVGDLVLLDSSDRRKRLHTRKRRAAKLMDRFDGPCRIVAAQTGISTYTLQFNKDDSAVPFFQTGKLTAYRSYFRNCSQAENPRARDRWT